MSLSFVKSAVLSSTDGISHNEETIIDNRETQSVRASGSGGGGHKPLFEQLRANKDADQERDEEFQKSLRGMRPLDEEDCAHLDAVERRRMEQEHAVKSGVEWEVAMFRAAKKDRTLIQTVVEDGGRKWIQGGESFDRIIATEAEETNLMEENRDAKKNPEGIQPNNNAASKGTSIMTKIVPKFTIKKKRKRVPPESSAVLAEGVKQCADARENDEQDLFKITDVKAGVSNERTASAIMETNSNKNEEVHGGDLLGLGCYGSDSD